MPLVFVFQLMVSVTGADWVIDPDVPVTMTVTVFATAIGLLGAM